MRLVIISAFYYVATAAGVDVVEKPDYIPCKELCDKLRAFVAKDTSSLMDKANAVRLLHCLRVVTNDDPHLVEVIHPHPKPYPHPLPLPLPSPSPFTLRS